MKPQFSAGSLIHLCVLLSCLAISPGASALTINEVAGELACPCECPLVLEDCNMTCGLEWKNQIGEMIAKGMTKQQIVEEFIRQHGDEARITPMQRVRGKVYQYTRSFDTTDWMLLWGGLIVWLGLMFFAIYLGVRKLSAREPRD